MNEFVIYLKVEPYLAEFVTHHLGNPAKFPSDSPENRLIKRFLDKTPINVHPDLGEGSNLAIVIPYSKEKNPTIYNYFSPKAKNALIESIESIFINNMWKELSDLKDVKCQITTLIYAYLEKHGMDQNHWETIRQKYYRIRKKYSEKNIKLG